MIGLQHWLTLGLFQNLFDGPDIFIVGVIALLLFGNRLPDLARSMGRTIVEFKKGLKETRNEVDKATKDDADGNAYRPQAQIPPSQMSQMPPADNPRQIKQVSSTNVNSTTDEP